MSDTYYREQAARRAQRLYLIGGIVAVFACAASSLFFIFRDTCTRSFDRSPEAVVNSFVEGISSGDVSRLTSCWQHQAYFDLNTGCSEICLANILGTRFQLVGVQLGEPVLTAEGRAQILAEVTASCPLSEEQHIGEITLDSIASDVPWRHWKIVHSTFGGPLADPWCQ